MKAPKLNLRVLLIAVSALLGGLTIGGIAVACTTGCPTPPTCCSPPPAPPKPPAPPTGCCGGGHNVNIPGVNVNIGATVIVNANSSATATANSGASSGASSGAGSLAGSAAGVTNYYGGGGHGGYYSGPMASGYIQGLNVEGGEARRRESYLATRTKTRRVIIRAVCLDDRDIPHPASQVTPDRDIDDGYNGELYRCIAGSRMQYVIADYSGQIDISNGGGGQTFVCQKNEALYHIPGAGQGQGSISCRPQAPARDCNERSLLRRFGAGVKILTIITTETYTAYREETVQERQALTTSFSLDGGVGGVVY